MERREEQPGAAGAGAAPALDFTVENVEKVRGPWGGQSGDRAQVLGTDTNARAQALGRVPAGMVPPEHLAFAVSLGRRGQQCSGVLMGYFWLSLDMGSLWIL